MLLAGRTKLLAHRVFCKSQEFSESTLHKCSKPRIWAAHHNRISNKDKSVSQCRPNMQTTSIFKVASHPVNANFTASSYCCMHATLFDRHRHALPFCTRPLTLQLVTCSWKSTQFTLTVTKLPKTIERRKKHTGLSFKFHPRSSLLLFMMEVAHRASYPSTNSPSHTHRTS